MDIPDIFLIETCCCITLEVSVADAKLFKKFDSHLKYHNTKHVNFNKMPILICSASLICTAALITRSDIK